MGCPRVGSDTDLGVKWGPDSASVLGAMLTYGLGVSRRERSTRNATAESGFQERPTW